MTLDELIDKIHKAEATEYLVERGHLGDVRASQLQTAATVDFERIRNLVDTNDPSYRIYPTYEKLISGPRFHSEP